MIGKLLSKTIGVASLPLVAAECIVDLATGGDGTRRDLKKARVPLPTDLTDALRKAAEELDRNEP